MSLVAQLGSSDVSNLEYQIFVLIFQVRLPEENNNKCSKFKIQNSSHPN
jgi:hypothetical protein